VAETPAEEAPVAEPKPVAKKAPAKKAAAKKEPAVAPVADPPAAPAHERSWSTPSASTTSLPPVQPGVPITKAHVAGVAAVLGLLVVRRRRRKHRS
jgi:MYXO-CTERM domain-containing protein